MYNNVWILQEIENRYTLYNHEHSTKVSQAMVAMEGAKAKTIHSRCKSSGPIHYHFSTFVLRREKSHEMPLVWIFHLRDRPADDDTFLGGGESIKWKWIFGWAEIHFVHELLVHLSKQSIYCIWSCLKIHTWWWLKPEIQYLLHFNSVCHVSSFCSATAHISCKSSAFYFYLKFENIESTYQFHVHLKCQ